MRSRILTALLLVSLTAGLSAQEKPAAGFRPPGSALEILRKFDIGDSQLGNFFSGYSLGPAEEEVLTKILYRWSRLGQENVESWRQKGVTWDQVVAAPAEHRGEIHHFRGRAKLASKIMLWPEAAERLEFDHYFVATVKIEDSPSVALIYARFLPTAWKLDAEIDEPVSVDGMFLKVGDAAAEPPPLIFAAERIAWHPDKPNPEVHIGPDQVALAQAGVDWGLYEVVKAENGRGIGGPDREPFYQTMAVIAGEKGPKLAVPANSVDIPLLLQKAETVLGGRMKVRGIAQRITKVTVTAEDIRQRFGIDHYYEIGISVALDKPMKVAKSAQDKEALLYANNFPVTLLVPRLPDNLREGENVHDEIAADATFYKLWTYQSSYASQKNKRQAAPLLMASEVRLIQRGNPLSGFSSAIATTAMLLAGGTFFIVYWWFRLSDRKTRAGRSASNIHDALRQGAAQASSEKPNFDSLK
ncbi:MAG: hypothetical protein ACR2FY_14965 [Pirellulaceae bacterium]